ncbi:MAG: FAD-binding protein [Candidatus Glassbacteria bacterium]|nr:FAD-binding protein [Candidatus Glassbacteria bacterium]
MERFKRLLPREIAGLACFDLPTRLLYSSDASIYEIIPAGVVFPRDERDLLRTMELAAGEGLTIIPRGGGSGLAGEALGSGIVVEFSRFMNRVVSVDSDGELVTVQPGVVLDCLNERLAPLGRMIGPDPSSSGRCTVGGMVGNDATGARSIIYGHTRDHVKWLDVVLADGTPARFEPVPLERLGSKHAPGIEAEVYAEIPGLLAASAGPVAADRPRTGRDRSGYNLAGALENGRFHPHRLVTGSEGSLAVIGGICLSTVRRPAFRQVIALYFRELLQATDSLVPLMRHGPSAVELIDKLMIGLAQDARPEYKDLLPAGVGACLLVECVGDTREEAEGGIERIRRDIVGNGKLAFGGRIPAGPQETAVIWDLRKAGVPLLYRRPGPEQPVPFIEDAAVPLEELSSYVRKISAIFRRHGLTAAFYGHAGGGELHIRPYLDLRQERQIDLMQEIAAEVCDLVAGLGGTLSGEHGEGLVRSQFISRLRPNAYPVYREVKRIFDPDRRLNPDKIITDDSRLMGRNLRFGRPYRARPPRLRFNYHSQPYAEIVERCNGCGDCRSLVQYSMCPVFKATGLEAASPRAKANLLRHLLYGRVGERGEFSRALKEVYDYCIGCGMCAVECPSGVDIPRLMMEAKVRYAGKYGLGPGELLLSEADLVSAVASRLAPLANLVNRSRAARLLMEWTTGIDRRRRLPPFRFPRRLRPGKPSAAAGERPRVALFRDLFACYNDPSLAQAVADLLAEAAGAEVVVPELGSCGITAMAYGNRASAFRLVEKNLDTLAGLVDQGYAVVSQEPTSVLTLRREYPGWTASPGAEKVARNTFELFEYLCLLEDQGKLKPMPDRARLEMKLVYHAPCHLKALQVGRPSHRFLARIAGLELVDSRAACCGIAGTFGLKAADRDLSLRMGAGIFEKLEGEGVDGGLSECSTCRMQMEHQGSATYHPAELLAHCYGIMTLEKRRGLDSRGRVY